MGSVQWSNSIKSLSMARSQIRKTNRATRQPKTNFTGVETNFDPFAQSEGLDFNKIEAAYCQLEDAAKDHVRRIVAEYLWQDHSAHFAFHLSDVEKAIDRLTVPIGKLLQEIEERDNTNPAETSVRSFVDTMGWRNDRITCSETITKLEGLRIACEEARRTILKDSEGTGFREADGWKS